VGPSRPSQAKIEGATVPEARPRTVQIAIGAQTPGTSGIAADSSAATGSVAIRIARGGTRLLIRPITSAAITVPSVTRVAAMPVVLATVAGSSARAVITIGRSGRRPWALVSPIRK